MPAGRYRLDGTLTLINTSITLRGAGAATVFAGGLGAAAIYYFTRDKP